MFSISPLTYKNNKLKSWCEMFKDKEVKLNKIKYDFSWAPLFDSLFSEPKIENIETELSKEIENDSIIYPYPELLFNAFYMTNYDNLKVVILGQDPYFDNISCDDVIIPQAMGLSFSVPYDIPVPSSLNNIYKNLFKHKHIVSKPTHGNLEYWAAQGCLMLNSALTVRFGSQNKNCHKFIWKWFTDKIIKYISQNKEHIVFVLWGADAFSKMNLIDLSKHEVIITSHPSGLSCDKPLREYPAFNDYDHFGEINKILKKWKLEQIIW